MKISLAVILILTFLFFSCKQKLNHVPITDFKDSLLKKYILMVDTLEDYDTTDINFKILKAYYLDDTTTINNLKKYIERNSTKTQGEKDMDSCISLYSIKDSNYEEAYRFSYWQAFCTKITTLTIKKYKDSAILNTLVYQYAWDANSCKILEQYNIRIDSAKWEKFKESIDKADFWGLKEDNGVGCLDGWGVNIWGFVKGDNTSWNPTKYQHIHRGCTITTINDPFDLLLLYSHSQKSCLRIGKY